MNKTYKHRTMWRIAEKRDHINSWDYTIDAIDANYSWWSKAYPDLRVVRTIPCELIEDSSDRIELEAKDWISNCIDDIDEVIYDQISEHQKVDIRKILCKHIPQEKKFTKQDIRKIADNFTANNEYRFQVIQDFLKSHNLLSYTVE